jgi:hypothetical protein
MAGDGPSWGAETVAIGRGEDEQATGQPDAVALASRKVRSGQARVPRRALGRKATAPAWLRVVPLLAGGAALLVFVFSVVSGGGSAPIRDADPAPRPAIEKPAAQAPTDAGRRERDGGRKAPAPGLERKLERKERKRRANAAAVRRSSERSAGDREQKDSKTPPPPPAPEPEPAPAPVTESAPTPEPAVEPEASAPAPEKPAGAEFGM